MAVRRQQTFVRPGIRAWPLVNPGRITAGSALALLVVGGLLPLVLRHVGGRSLHGAGTAVAAVAWAAFLLVLLVHLVGMARCWSWSPNSTALGYCLTGFFALPCSLLWLGLPGLSPAEFAIAAPALPCVLLAVGVSVRTNWLAFRATRAGGVTRASLLRSTSGIRPVDVLDRPLLLGLRAVDAG